MAVYILNQKRDGILSHSRISKTHGQDNIVNIKHLKRIAYRFDFLRSFSSLKFEGLWFESWCLTPLPTIFQLYRGGQFYW
jgi:hypothetical protein